MATQTRANLSCPAEEVFLTSREILAGESSRFFDDSGVCYLGCKIGGRSAMNLSPRSHCGVRQLAAMFVTALALFVFAVPAFAEGDEGDDSHPKRLLGYYTGWSKYNAPPYTADQ